LSSVTTPIRDAGGDLPGRSRTRETAPAGLRLPFDPVLLLAVAGICAGSLVTLAYATPDDVPGSPHYYVVRQAAFFAVGLVLACALWLTDYSRLRELKYAIYGLVMAGILATQLVGGVTRGSRRAIQLPFFEIQFSELGKVLLVVALAGFVVDRSRALGSGATAVRIMVLALVPAALVLSQDLGSGTVYVVVALAVLFIAGASWRAFAAIAAVGAVAAGLALVAAPAAGVEVLKPYQKDRLVAFLHPTENPSKQGYQQNQSRIAIGSGEKTGRGDRATQTRLNFLPEHHTDFAFAVVGERWGFVGAAFLLSMYALLVWRGLRIVTTAKNLFGAIVAGGIVGMLLFEVFVNVGMNIGIAPITGIPLPLLSYGGSSVLSTFLAIGLLQSIHAQARVAATQKGAALSGRTGL
jgi:rod shape determining protein RodA